VGVAGRPSLTCHERRRRRRKVGAAVTDYKENTGLTDDYWEQTTAHRTSRQLQMWRGESTSESTVVDFYTTRGPLVVRRENAALTHEA